MSADVNAARSMRTHYDVAIDPDGTVMSLTGQVVCLIGHEQEGRRWRCRVSAEYDTASVDGEVLAHHPGGPMIAVTLQRALLEAGEDVGDGTAWLEREDMIEFAQGALALHGWVSERIPLSTFARLSARLRLG